MLLATTIARDPIRTVVPKLWIGLGNLCANLLVGATTLIPKQVRVHTMTTPSGALTKHRFHGALVIHRRETEM